jgi:hypothetical protein
MEKNITNIFITTYRKEILNTSGITLRHLKVMER